MSKPLFFYSAKCSTCQKLWKYLKEKNRLDQFVKICIDNNKKIPSIIQGYPCIFLKGREPMYGQAITMFLNSNSQANISKTTSSSSSNSSSGKEKILNGTVDKKPEFETSTNKLNGISDFSPIEMGALYSDSYSFIQDNPAPMDFCFEFLGQCSNKESEPKRELSEIDRRMERLRAERNM